MRFELNASCKWDNYLFGNYLMDYSYILGKELLSEGLIWSRKCATLLFSKVCETKYNSLFLKDQRISWLLFFSSNQMQLFSLYAFWVTLRGCLFCVSLCFSTKNKTFLEERRIRIQKKLWDCFANLSTKTEKLLQPCVLFLNMFFIFSIFCKMFS